MPGKLGLRMPEGDARAPEGDARAMYVRLGGS